MLDTGWIRLKTRRNDILENHRFDLDAARPALNRLGWKPEFEIAYRERAAEGLIPARVLSRHRDRWSLALAGHQAQNAPYAEEDGILPGALRADPDRADADQPTAGDWVLVDAAPQGSASLRVIRAVLPRYSAFLRRRAGPVVAAQAIAANVDCAAIVMGLDSNFNLRRLERCLSLSWESGASPIVILTKADLAESSEGALEEKVRQAEASAPAMPVFTVCAPQGTGIAELSAALAPGTTTLFLGSSGAGKSTLLNALAGSELQETGSTRAADGKGKHTTTRRDLFLLNSGAMIIDSPGMREIGLWGGEEGVASEFPDVEAFASSCRFADCSHNGEPGCGIRAAVEDGRLDPGRWENYQKQMKELAYLHRLVDAGAARAERQRWKGISKFQKEFKKGPASS
jgi:ribosome biogenesis GTPase / thiamine phosphate phosphatase